MLDKWSRIVTIAGRDPSREIRLMRGSRCTTEPPEAAVAKGASTPGFGSRHPPAAHFLPHAGKISLRLVRVPDCGHWLLVWLLIWALGHRYYQWLSLCSLSTTRRRPSRSR